MTAVQTSTTPMATLGLLLMVVVGAFVFWPKSEPPYTDAEKAALRRFDKDFMKKPHLVLADVERQNAICIPQVAGGELPDYAYEYIQKFTIFALWSGGRRNLSSMDSDAGRIAKAYTNEALNMGLAEKIRADGSTGYFANKVIQRLITTNGKPLLRCVATALYNPKTWAERVKARRVAKKQRWRKRDEELARRRAERRQQAKAEAERDADFRGSL